MQRQLRSSGFARSLLLLASVSIAAACSSGGTDNNNPGTIALALSPNSLSVPAGGLASTVGATLTRGGGFTGTVNLTVTGAPTGVTATVSNIVTTGTTTTATVTILADASTIAGTYHLVAHGTGTGVTEATADFTLTVTAVQGSYTIITNTVPHIVQGGTGPASILLVRVNFTGDVTLSLVDAPAGITGTFDPNPATGGTATLNLSVASTVAPNTYNMTVRGTSSLPDARTQVLTVVVTAAPPAGNFTLTTTPTTSVNVTQGSNTPVTVNIVRTGGNTSDVALTTTPTSLPAGLTLGFAPPSTTTNASTLTVAATNAVPVGAYPIVIHGNTAGLGEQVVNLTINVVAPGGSTLMYDVGVCAVADRPVFVAVQDGGPSAPWQVITPVGTVYQFTFHQSTLGAAWVTLGSGGASALNIYHFTLAQLVLNGPGFCAPPAGGITVNGTVVHLNSGFIGLLNFGGAFSSVTSNLPFQLDHASAGVNDLVAYMHPLPSGGAADRGFISRGLNPGNGGSVGTVDFTGANSFAPAAANGSISGVAVGETVTEGMAYYTGTGANACTRASLYLNSPVTGSTFIGYGVPPANQVATDFHSIGIFALGSGFFPTGRGVQEDFHTFATRMTTPFALPSVIPAPVITSVLTPYKQLNMTVTPPADLNAVFSMLQTDQAAPGKTVFVNLSGQYIAGGAAAFTVPDFSALAGWDNAWAPAGGDVLSWTLSGTGSVGTPCTDGHRFVQSSRTGQN